jgi:hypothetical protein
MNKACAKNLARIFRGKWLAAMVEEGLVLRPTLLKDWIVDCRHVGHGEKALTYLGNTSTRRSCASRANASKNI